jgi:phage recombination protein Bet
MELNFTEQELKALRAEIAPQASDDQFAVFMAECRHRGLYPGRDVILQIRGSREWDSEVGAEVYKKKATQITTIGALRKIANDTGVYAGQLPSKWIYLDDQNKVTESEFPLPEEPYAVKATVLRRDFQAPLTVVARFDAYKQTKNNGNLTSMWARRGSEQLEKCAEALALRKAFPEKLSGLYISEEIAADREDRPETEQKVTAPAPELPAVPAVNQTPVAPTEAPRPKNEFPTGFPVHEVPSEKPEPTDADYAAAVNALGADMHKEADATMSAFPSKEQKTLYAKRMRVYSRELLPKAGIAEPEPVLREFIKGLTGIEDLKNLTVGQWEKVLGRLDAAHNTGKLKDVVTF